MAEATQPQAAWRVRVGALETGQANATHAAGWVKAGLVMDAGRKRLLREQYPFLIAHAHKQTLAFLADNAQKLPCLLQAAETVSQCLALVGLAPLPRDLEHHQAPALGSRSSNCGTSCVLSTFGLLASSRACSQRRRWENCLKSGFFPILPESRER